MPEQPDRTTPRARTRKLQVRQPVHRSVVAASGVALLVLMTTDWKRLSGPDLMTQNSNWFEMIRTAARLGRPILAVPVILAVLLIVLPVHRIVTTIVAAVGLLWTLDLLRSVLPPDLGDRVHFNWLPPAYISIAVWLIALAAAVHARVTKAS